MFSRGLSPGVTIESIRNTLGWERKQGAPVCGYAFLSGLADSSTGGSARNGRAPGGPAVHEPPDQRPAASTAGTPAGPSRRTGRPRIHVRPGLRLLRCSRRPGCQGARRSRRRAAPARVPLVPQAPRPAPSAPCPAPRPAGPRARPCRLRRETTPPQAVAVVVPAVVVVAAASGGRGSGRRPSAPLHSTRRTARLAAATLPPTPRPRARPRAGLKARPPRRRGSPGTRSSAARPRPGA